MSYNNFKLACRRMETLDEFDPGEPKTVEEILNAEKDLGIKFSNQCKEFYAKYDYTSFSGVEIFGIANGANARVLEGNIVAYTLDERKNYALPHKLIPFFNCGDGTLVYYDYNNLNKEGEPHIIRCDYDSDAEKYIVIEDLAEDFGDFLNILINAL